MVEPGAVGVIMYLTIPGAVPELVNGVFMILPQVEAQGKNPDTEPDNTEAVQEKVAPAVAEVMV
jgi:hypothetical protein